MELIFIALYIYFIFVCICKYYYIKIKACISSFACCLPCSIAVKWLCNLLLSAVPGAPQNLQVSEVTNDSVTLSWNKPTSDGNSPIVQYILVAREKSKKKYKKCGKAEGTSFKVTSNIEAGHEYYFRVYAENSLGISEEWAELDEPVKVKVTQDKEEKVKVTEDKEEEKVKEERMDDEDVNDVERKPVSENDILATDTAKAAQKPRRDDKDNEDTAQEGKEAVDDKMDKEEEKPSEVSCH